MKKILLTGAVILTQILSGQKVTDSITVKFPILGSESQNMMKWLLNENATEIKMYVYNHLRGGQIVATQKEMDEAKQKHQEKGWFGKFLSSAGKSNLEDYVIIPIISETSVNIANRKINENTIGFHKINSLKSGENVYFNPSSGMIDLNMGFSEGNILKYHYNDIQNAFPNAPKIDQALFSFGDVDFKGEGLIGLKNIQPYLIKKTALFKYDPTRGYLTSPEKEQLVNLKTISGSENMTLVSESHNSSKGNFVLWYESENKPNFYKLLYYNINTGASHFNEVQFENNREIKVANQVVFNEKDEPVGFFSVFGHHKKQNKEGKQYIKGNFDFILTDLSGKIVEQKNIDFGDDDAYKRILDPIYIRQLSDGTLQLANNHALSLLKVRYEVLNINLKDGKITSNGLEEYDKDIKGSKTNLYWYMYKPTERYVFGEQLLLINNSDEDIIKNGISSKVNNGFMITLLDKNFAVKNAIKFSDILKTNSHETFTYKVVEKTNDKICIIARQGSSYFMIKANKDETIEATRIATPYEKTALADIYFSLMDNNYVLKDEKSRKLYLLNQYYMNRDGSTKTLYKVGITTVEY